MAQLTITLEAPDNLSREVWKFRIDRSAGDLPQINVYLTYWANQPRSTRRHGWVATYAGFVKRLQANQTRSTRRHGWQIVGKHFDTYDRDYRNPANAPNVPDHVWAAFKDEYMRRLTYAGVQGAGA